MSRNKRHKEELENLQEFEHFDSKADESLTDLYDRFMKLLNDLSLVGNEYEPEDFNTKFFHGFS